MAPQWASNATNKPEGLEKNPLVEEHHQLASDQPGSPAEERQASFRTAAVCRMDASDKLRRLDELLEVARAKLLAMVHSGNEQAGQGDVQAGLETLAASGVGAAATRVGTESTVRQGRESAQDDTASGPEADSEVMRNAGSQHVGAVGAKMGSPARDEARCVADILESVAQASALVQGDLAERLTAAAKRCAQCDSKLPLHASVMAAWAMLHMLNLPWHGCMRPVARFMLLLRCFCKSSEQLKPG